MQQESARLGRYRLVERIAAGGMAEVYLARMVSDGGLEKTVVIKTILPELTGSEQVRTMMLDEARIGFSLRHQNIAQVLDVGREGDTLYVAIEHIDGLDLARLQRVCDQCAIELDPMLVVYIGVEMLRALDYAHRRRGEDGEELGIVHRDISPHNVLLSIEGEVKLTDFGIARARDRLSKTTTGATKGKLAYMAPEQAAGKEIDVRADLFGVAATLYEALCGSPPFHGTNDLEVLKAVQAGTVTPLTVRCPLLDPLLAGVIDSALANEPNDRPANATEMRRPLEEVLRGQSASADELSDLVRRAQAEQRALRQQNSAFERAVLGIGATGTATGVAGGTPTDPSTRALPVRPAAAKSTSTWPVWLAALVAIAAAAALTFALTRGDDDAGESPAPPPQPVAVADPQPQPEPEPDPEAQPDPDPPLKRRPKRPARTGTVNNTSLPWARVTIDGKYIGNTPLKNHSLPVGTHKVKLHNPETGQTESRTVDVRTGKNSSLRVKL